MGGVSMRWEGWEEEWGGGEEKLKGRGKGRESGVRSR